MIRKPDLLPSKIILCPECGGGVSENQENVLVCLNCSANAVVQGNIINWNARETVYEAADADTILKKVLLLWKTGELLSRVFEKIKSCYQRLSPSKIRYRKQIEHAARHMARFYESLIETDELSRYWGERYLKGLEVSKGMVCLDFGCGQGRNVAHLLNLGCQAWGQEIFFHPWWKKLDSSRVVFQVVSPSTSRLPWRSGSVSLLITTQVLAFFEEKRLKFLLEEFCRVIKPGGNAVFIESNPGSNALHEAEYYYGRNPYTKEFVQQLLPPELVMLDSWYEGYYAKSNHYYDNLDRLYERDSVGPLDIYDPIDQTLEPENRGLWVMRIQKVK